MAQYLVVEICAGERSETIRLGVTRDPLGYRETTDATMPELLPGHFGGSRA